MAAEDALFLAYVAMLALTGVLFLVAALLAKDGRGGGIILGVLALGYAAYLFFDVWISGGTYYVFWYAIVAPFIAAYQIYKAVKARAAAKRASQDLFAQQVAPAAGGLAVPAAPSPAPEAPQSPIVSG